MVNVELQELKEPLVPLANRVPLGHPALSSTRKHLTQAVRSTSLPALPSSFSSGLEEEEEAAAGRVDGQLHLLTWPKVAAASAGRRPPPKQSALRLARP